MNIATTADNCELQAPAKAAADENKAQLALLGGQTEESRESKEHQGSLVPVRKERERENETIRATSWQTREKDEV